MEKDIIPKLLLEIKKNQVIMMKNRGYDISDEEFIFNFTFTDFTNYYKKEAMKNNVRFNESLNKIYKKLTDTNSLCYVYFFYTNIEKQAICSGQIDLMIKHINKIPYIKDVILISEKKISKTSNLYNLLNKRFQHFLFNELYMNIIDSIYVPKHRILSASEVIELKEGSLFNFENSNLPQFRILDPIIKYLGAVEGDIIEVERVNFLLASTVERSIFYGIVSDTSITTENIEEES